LISIKQQLYNYCQTYLSKRIATAEEAIRASQESANEETKSSSGDKYETGRAMMQLEMEKDSTQLAEALKLKRLLDSIKIETRAAAVQSGSLVITDTSNFFIAISVGQITLEDKIYLVVSAESPIGSKLIGLKTGETFIFANKTYKIEQVW
jgi:transcription elongation GreA/GreB family factor